MSEYGGRRRLGKSLQQAAIIRAYAYPSGLPRTNFVLARINNMVKWDKDTGEVSTIEYKADLG